MLKNILLATRAHYAALQHRASPDRTPLHYTVGGVLSGTVQVKVSTRNGYIDNGKRKREMTKLINRLQAMYPETSDIEVSFK
jgi:hypothetical protein